MGARRPAWRQASDRLPIAHMLAGVRWERGGLLGGRPPIGLRSHHMLAGLIWERGGLLAGRPPQGLPPKDPAACGGGGRPFEEVELVTGCVLFFLSPESASRAEEANTAESVCVEIEKQTKHM